MEKEMKMGTETEHPGEGCRKAPDIWPYLIEFLYAVPVFCLVKKTFLERRQ